jgi:hypothetical protein
MSHPSHLPWLDHPIILGKAYKLWISVQDMIIKVIWNLNYWLLDFMHCLVL